jgi:hypothetical protein
MKKLIPVIALLVGVSSAFGQGVVNFRNENLIPAQLVRGADMTTPLTGTTYAIQLLYGADSASLTPHPTLAYFRTPTTLSPGTWSGANRTLTGVALPATPAPGTVTFGPQIWMQVLVWDSGAGRVLNYSQARAQGLLWGDSAIYQYQQRASDPSDVNDTAMRNFVGFSLVPEPSVIGLGLIGVGALFMLRRRKA